MLEYYRFRKMTPITTYVGGLAKRLLHNLDVLDGVLAALRIHPRGARLVISTLHIGRDERAEQATHSAISQFGFRKMTLTKT